jgi:hypothetical protein
VARHFLNLPGAATLETESYLLAQRAVADAVEADAMAVLHGDAGLGKTFAVEDALAAPALPLLWVSFPARPTPRLIAATLLEAITGRASRLDRFAIIRRLVERLSEAPAIVVVDESQLLTSAASSCCATCTITARRASRSCLSAATAPGACSRASRCWPAASTAACAFSRSPGPTCSPPSPRITRSTPTPTPS